MERPMNNCEQFQTQLLAYLYDLLDPNEAQTVKEHLEVCPACRGALERAQNQKKILSVAAKAEFPNVQFQPPEHEKVATARAGRRLRPVPRWDIAASILLVLGIGAPAGWWVIHDFQLARTAAARAELYENLKG